MTKFDMVAQAISEETGIGLDAVRKVLETARKRNLLVVMQHSEVKLPSFSVLTGDRADD